MISPKQALWYLILVAAVIGTALASSMVEGKPKQGQVVTAKLTDKKKNHWKLTVKLLEHPAVQSSGFYKASDYKKGSVVDVVVEYSKHQFQPGDKIHVTWMSYSAMGPNGAVGGLSWKFLSKP